MGCDGDAEKHDTFVIALCGTKDVQWWNSTLCVWYPGNRPLSCFGRNQTRMPTFCANLESDEYYHLYTCDKM
eukprot:3856983-Prorocentrum_lima.AAC.1